jgi:hypothetical protein
MEAWAIAIVSGVVSGLGAAALSGWVTLRKVRRDLEAAYDSDLRGKRLDHYLALWPRFSCLAITKREMLTHAVLQDFSDDLRSWYFNEGGLFMSRASQYFYNQLQRKIASSLSAGEDLDEGDLGEVRFLASSLRTRLTEDIGSRRSSMFSPPRPVIWWRKKSLTRRLRGARETH